MRLRFDAQKIFCMCLAGQSYGQHLEIIQFSLPPCCIIIKADLFRLFLWVLQVDLQPSLANDCIFSNPGRPGYIRPYC